MHPTTCTSASIRHAGKTFATVFPHPTPLPQASDARTRSYLAGSFGRVPLAVYLTDTLNREELRLHELLCIVSHDQHLVYRDLDELAAWLHLSPEVVEKAFEGLRQRGLIARTDDHISLAPLTPLSLKSLPSPSTPLVLVSSEPTDVNDGVWSLTSLATALDARLTSLQRRLFGWYRAVAGADGVSWWSTKKIATHLGVARESISRARTALGEMILVESVQDRPYRTAVTRVLAPESVHVADLADPDRIGLHPDAITQEPDPEPNHEEINTRTRGRPLLHPDDANVERPRASAVQE